MNQTILKISSLFFLAVLTNELYALYAPYGVYKEGTMNGVARQHPIYEAISQCKQKEVIKILNEGASANQAYIKGQDSYQDYKYTPLYYLINDYVCPPSHKGFTQEDGEIKLKIARTLLEHGANPNAKWDEYSGNEKESTYPLNYAIHNFQNEVYKKSDEYNQNSVDYQRKLILLLLEKGADVHLKGFGFLHDSTPLEILLEHTYNFNQENIQEIFFVAEELISKGAKVENKLFINLLEHNENGKYDEILEFLIEHGADVNAVESGIPLLEFIADNNGKKFLLDHGAKLSSLPVYKQEQLQEEGIALREHATIVEIAEFYFSKVWDTVIPPVIWIWDFVSSAMGLVAVGGMIALIFGFKKFKLWSLNRKRENAKIAINKIRRSISKSEDRLNNIDCSYFPEELSEASDLKSRIQDIHNNLKNALNTEKKFDAKSYNTNVKDIEKAVDSLAKKVQNRHEELAKIKPIYEKAKENYDFMNRSMAKISQEIHAYEGFEGLEIYQSKIREYENRSSAIKERIDKVKKSFEDIKQFVDKEISVVHELIEDFKNFENEWDRFKDALREYQPLMKRTQILREKSERSASECSSIGEESAFELQKVFEGITEECHTIVRDISGSTHRKEVVYYEERIRTLEQQYNDAQREFNEKFKAVADFKRLSSDREKKEWILKNGYISWFFDDPKIAEKFREFDSMEEKFKYLIKASKKLRFLDIDQREEKTTWPVFMQRIHSDMSYAEMKSFMDEWQTDPKFPKIVEQWFKKLTEQDAEQKQEIMVTQKFIGLKF